MKEKKEFAGLLPPLSKKEYQSLYDDIKARGRVVIPPIVDEEGFILDGHHRVKIANKLKAKIPTPIVKKDLKTEAEKKAFIIKINIDRRHLSDEQKKEQRDKMKAIAKDLRAIGKTQSEVAAILGVVRRTVDEWESKGNIVKDDIVSTPDLRMKIHKKEHAVIHQRISEGEDIKQVAADYKVTPRRMRQIENKEKKREEKKITKTSIDLPEDTSVVVADFSDHLLTLPDNSVDLIFTDPPYNKESIPMYGKMADIASVVLKPGGSLITYVGHYAIPDILNLMSAHLRYWWICAVKHEGPSARMMGYGIFVEWKPLLWFVKEKRKEDKIFVSDYIISKIPTKDEHDWQQSITEASFYIDKLTEENDLIVDPFCGSGTTLIAAKQLKRKSIGIEINPETAEIAKTRISEWFQE